MKDPGEFLKKVSESLPKDPLIDGLIALVQELFEENKQQAKVFKQEIQL